MWSDVLTKPKQCIAFQVFRGQLMNVSEDYHGKIERVNPHPDLLPPAEDMEKLLEEDRVVLIKVLTPRVVPRDTKAAVKAVSPRVAPGGTVAPRNGIRLYLATSGIKKGLSII